MGKVIVKIKVMPTAPNADLESIESAAKKKAEMLGVNTYKVERVPIAFGLTALHFIFLVDDAAGGTEKLEEELAKIPEVKSIEVIDIRRAIG